MMIKSTIIEAEYAVETLVYNNNNNNNNSQWKFFAALFNLYELLYVVLKNSYEVGTIIVPILCM